MRHNDIITWLFGSLVSVKLSTFLQNIKIDDTILEWFVSNKWIFIARLFHTFRINSTFFSHIFFFQIMLSQLITNEKQWNWQNNLIKWFKIICFLAFHRNVRIVGTLSYSTINMIVGVSIHGKRYSHYICCIIAFCLKKFFLFFIFSIC